MSQPSYLPYLQAIGLSASAAAVGSVFTHTYLGIPAVLAGVPQGRPAAFAALFGQGMKLALGLVAVSTVSNGTLAWTARQAAASSTSPSSSSPAAQRSTTTSTLYALAAASIFTFPIFTAIAIKPTNDLLLGAAKGTGARVLADGEVVHLLTKWGSLNLVRVGLALASTAFTGLATFGY